MDKSIKKKKINSLLYTKNGTLEHRQIKQTQILDENIIEQNLILYTKVVYKEFICFQTCSVYLLQFLQMCTCRLLYLVCITWPIFFLFFPPPTASIVLSLYLKYVKAVCQSAQLKYKFTICCTTHFIVPAIAHHVNSSFMIISTQIQQVYD